MARAGYGKQRMKSHRNKQWNKTVPAGIITSGLMEEINNKKIEKGEI